MMSELNIFALNFKNSWIMTGKLYIIGNGFDLHHGLKTSYADFRDNYAKKSFYLWNLLSDIYGESIYDDMWWSDFEKMLGVVDYHHLMNSRNGTPLGFMKTRNLLKGSLPPLFGSWIKKIGCNVEPDNSLEIEADSMFFSFNYTLLLEKVYGAKEDNVWHIHNSVKRPDDIIVGHDSDYRDLFVRMNNFKVKFSEELFRMDFAQMINNEVANGAKKVKERIVRNEERFYNQYSSIKHYVVMGFSLNDIDLPYIEKMVEVNKSISDADWTLYCYKDGEYERMTTQLLNIGVSSNNILPPKSW